MGGKHCGKGSFGSFNGLWLGGGAVFGGSKIHPMGVKRKSGDSVLKGSPISRRYSKQSRHGKHWSGSCEKRTCLAPLGACLAGPPTRSAGFLCIAGDNALGAGLSNRGIGIGLFHKLPSIPGLDPAGVSQLGLGGRSIGNRSSGEAITGAGTGLA